MTNPIVVRSETSAFRAGDSHALHDIADEHRGRSHIGMLFARSWQIIHTTMRTHEQRGRMQTSIDKTLSRLAHVNAPEWRLQMLQGIMRNMHLRQLVRWHECEAVDADLVNGIDRLQHSAHPLQRAYKCKQCKSRTHVE